MEKPNIAKFAAHSGVSDLDLFGEISLSDDPDVSQSPLPSTDGPVNVFSELNDNVDNDSHFQKTPSEIQKHLMYLEARVNALESENSKLVEQLSECQMKETISRSTETIDLRDPGVHPGSVMSLSTGSEESALDEERFVKVKANCEIDTSSSKASSQSGKENFELEEQIAGLSHEVDTLKAELKARDDEYIRVKLTLEDLLLEKNVEAESISQASTQVTTLKDELTSKDNALDDVRLVLNEAIQNCQEYLSNDTENGTAPGSLEFMLSQINRISQLCTSSMEAAKEHEEEMTNCINGYQAISLDYEKLQQELETLKGGTDTREELERFKQELLSKDEDLFEIQTRFDETQQALEEKANVVVELEAKLASLESQETEHEQTLKLYKQKLLQAQKKWETTKSKLDEVTDSVNEKDVIIADLKLLVQEKTESQPASVTLPSQLSSEPVPVPTSSSSESPIKKLQQQCMSRIQATMKEYEEKESVSQERILSLQNEKTHLESMLLAKDEEISKLNSEMERLMSNVQVYQESIEQKALELTNCVNSKDSEMEQVISRYNQDSAAKDNHIAHLSQTIESQRGEILSLLQQQKETAAKHEKTLLHTKKMESDVAAWNKQFANYEATANEQDVLINALTLDMQQKDQQVDVLRNQFDEVSEDLNRLRAAYQNAENDYQANIGHIRREFERKHTEEQVLRESEQLSDRKMISDLMAQLSQLTNEMGLRGNEISDLTQEKWELEGDGRLKDEEITVLKEMVASAEHRLNAAIDSNEVLSSDNLDLRTALETAQQTLDAEVQARSAAESALTTYLKEQNQNRVALEEQLQVERNVPVQVTSVVGESLETVQDQLQAEVIERAMLERKVELLQTKISEIENAEIKSFEDSFMLKGWVRQLELENLKYQDQLNSLLVNSPDSDALHPKLKTLQDEVIRLINALEERDKRCEQLTLEITRLLEERDGLQLKLSNVLKHNVALTERINAGQEMTSLNEAPTYDKEGLQSKLAQLEDTNYKMTIDLKREREARRLVQEQLLFSQTSRVYRDLNTRTRDASGQSSISLDTGSKTPSSPSRSSDYSCSDSGHPSVTSLDSGEHLNAIQGDPMPLSTVVHI